MITLDMALTSGVILLAIALLVSEVVTVDLAALIIMGLLMALGLVSPQEGISGFSNPATITVLAMFILSAGIERTGAVTLLAQRLGRVAGGSDVARLAVIVGVVTFISAFINNTAAVAIMLPVALGLARDHGIPPSKLLIPVSFGAILGGLTTLIGTSTNLIGSAVSARLGYGTFSMFEFSLAGVVIALAGTAYLLTLGRYLLPDRGKDATDPMGQAQYVAEFAVPAGSKLVGQRVAALDLEGRHSVQVLAVRRGDDADPDPDFVLAAGDILLLRGSREKLVLIVNFEGLKFKGPGGGQEPLSDTDAKLFEAVVLPQSPLVGQTLEAGRFRGRFGGTVVAIRKNARLLEGEHALKRTPLHAGDALLVAGTQECEDRVRESGEFLLTGEVEARTFMPAKAALAIAIFGGIVLVSALGWADILVAAIVGTVLMALFGILSMAEFHRAIRWDVLFLLAGVIPLGIALERSGLSTALAGALIANGALAPLVLLVLVVAITMTLTNFMSHAATVVLLAPIGVSLAVASGVNPKMVILAVIFAASAGFASPIGYATNMMIYAPGRYKFSDFVRVGLPLTLLMLVVIPLAVLWLYPGG